MKMRKIYDILMKNCISFLKIAQNIPSTQLLVLLFLICVKKG